MGVRNQIFDSDQYAGDKKLRAEKTVYMRTRLPKSYQNPKNYDRVKNPRDLETYNQAVNYIISIIDNYLLGNGSGLRMSSYTDEEWRKIDEFISHLPKEKLIEAVASESSKSYNEKVENLKQILQNNDEKNKFKQSLIDSSRNEETKRQEDFYQFVDNVLEQVGDSIECKHEDDTTCILQNLAVIHARFSSSDEGKQAALHRIARRMISGWLDSKKGNIFLLELEEKKLAKIVDNFKENPEVTQDWHFMRRLQAGAELQHDTVTQRLINALEDKSDKPPIDFSSGRMLDAQDVDNTLIGGSGYELPPNTDALLPLEKDKNSLTWMMKSMQAELAEERLPYLINRIQQHILKCKYNGKLSVGIIIIRGERNNKNEPNAEPHEVNVTLTYDNQKFFKARVGDSIAAGDGRNGSIVGKQVVSFIKAASYKPRKPVQLEVTDPQIGHIGVLCGDLALMDLEEQLSINLFGNRRQTIKQELQEGKLKKGEIELGRRIRQATYYAVAEGKAKNLARDGRGAEQKLKQEFFDKIKEIADRRQPAAVSSSASPEPPSPRPTGRGLSSSSQSEQLDLTPPSTSSSASQNPASAQPSSASSSKPDKLKKKSEKTPPTQQQQSPITSDPATNEPVPTANSNDDGVPSTMTDNAIDDIKIQKEADGSETLTGNFLTAKIIEDEDSRTPTLKFSFSESEKVKGLSETEKEEKCESEFNEMLNRLHNTLISDEQKNKWQTADDGRIIVDIVISGDMSQAKQKQLKDMMLHSTHFKLEKVMHKETKPDTPPGSTSAKKSKIGKALDENSLIGKRKQQASERQLEEKSETPHILQI
jgi:hypothetical protein